jgi:signal peptidase I
MHGPLVKRIVGLGGETVEIANGQVHVNGRPLAEPWADGPTLSSGEWSIGRDEVFVLGDNRASGSVDSRSFGPVATQTLQWRVAFRYWPAARFGRVADLAAPE